MPSLITQFLHPCLVKAAAVYEKFKKMHPKVPSEIMFRAFFLNRFLASLGTIPMLRQQTGWVQKWYFVTKIVLTYCEKKLF